MPSVKDPRGRYGGLDPHGLKSITGGSVGPMIEYARPVDGAE